MEQIRKLLQDKLIPVLDHWAITFKFIGMGNQESPRWSQVMYDYDNEAIYLCSTQKDLYYYPELSEEETNMLYEYQMDFPTELWNTWKEMRNEYLAKNHSTIKL